jgi:hypothetical protein
MAVRVLPINALTFEQVDFLQGDFYTRVTGLDESDLTLVAFINNAPLNWTLVSGNGVSNAQVKTGFFYLNEISSGYYGLRFRPNAIGFWRIVVNYPAGVQSIALDYDILQPVDMTGGLKAQFIK